MNKIIEKEYHFEVNIISDCLISAESEKKAIRILKENWKDSNNIELVNKEIKLITVVSEKENKNGTKNITVD